MNTTVIYCQNCRHANSLKETFCQECGTRLLLVVFPNSLQYDTNHVPTFYEDHLLERISLLELRVSQLAERLESAFFLIQYGIEAFYKHQNSYRSFLEIAQQINPELAAAIEAKDKTSDNDIAEKRASKSKTKKILNEILDQHTNQNKEIFAQLIEKGIRLLAEHEEKQAFQMLERAALLSPQNVPLHVFIAENLFRADKYQEAKKYLEKIYISAPTNEKVLLLLGTVCADFADTEKARRLLSILTENKKNISAVNLIWAMLAAFENNWSEAIAAFKRASGENEIAEFQYLIGCAYFTARQNAPALAHLQKAVNLDQGFCDAYFMMSVVYRMQGDQAKAEGALTAAAANKENGAQSVSFLSGKKIWDAEIALPFMHLKNNKRILSGGALRFLKLLRKMIDDAIS